MYKKRTSFKYNPKEVKDILAFELVKLKKLQLLKWKLLEMLWVNLN